MGGRTPRLSLKFVHFWMLVCIVCIVFIVCIGVCVRVCAHNYVYILQVWIV